MGGAGAGVKMTEVTLRRLTEVLGSGFKRGEI